MSGWAEFLKKLRLKRRASSPASTDKRTGSEGRESGEGFQWVVVAHPDDFFGGVGHGAVDPHVDEPLDVALLLRKDPDAVAAQGPDFRAASLVTLQCPEGRPPEAQIDFRSAPQVAAGVPRIDPVQKLLRRMVWAY